MNTQSPTFSIILMGLLLLMMYFLMIRPQRKREKADKEMRAALRVGDEVITIGGIVGKVEKINDKTVVISTTAGKNKIEMLKTGIASVGGIKDADEQPKASKEAEAEEDTKTPSRDKKVTPKKLGKSEPKEEASKEE